MLDALPTIQTIRIKNLEQLIDNEFGGVRSRLADALGVPRSQISRLFSSSEGSRKNLGENLARKIEAASGVPEGWLDINRSLEELEASKPRSNYGKANTSTAEPEAINVLSLAPKLSTLDIEQLKMLRSLVDFAIKNHE